MALQAHSCDVGSLHTQIRILVTHGTSFTVFLGILKVKKHKAGAEVTLVGYISPGSCCDTVELPQDWG